MSFVIVPELRYTIAWEYIGHPHSWNLCQYHIEEIVEYAKNNCSEPFRWTPGTSFIRFENYDDMILCYLRAP